MDIKQLRYFVAIVEGGSFSAAAKQLRIAQPALSLQIRKIEDDLGIKLLLRGPQGVTTTEAGETLLHSARKILSDLSQTEDELRSMGQEPSGIVRIGLPGTISSILAVPLIARIRRKYPKIKLIIAEAMSGFVLEWLEHRRIDLAVLYSDNPAPGYSSKALLREELVMLIPPEAAPDCPTVEEAIEDMPLILPSSAHGLRMMLEQMLAKRTIRVEPTIEVDSYVNIKRLVSSGYGCSILPFHAIAQDVARGQLASLKFAAPRLWRSAHLVHQSAIPLKIAAQAVHDEIPLVIDDLLADNSWAGAERL